MNEPASQLVSSKIDGFPLGPDAKPLPGPQHMQKVIAQPRMAQQQAQVNEVAEEMKKIFEKVDV